MRARPRLQGRSRHCILCGGRLKPRINGLWDTRLGYKGEFRVVRCEACGLESISPAIPRERLAELYRKYYSQGGSARTIYSRLREAFLFSLSYRIWMAIDGDMAFHSLCGPGRLLDVGCYEGRSLMIYRRNGFRAEGIEANPRAAETARRHGFRVKCGQIESSVVGRKYDVAVMANVLEHCADPAEALNSVRRLLKPGGRLYLSCPNGRSWLRSVFGRRWINWHAPFHLFHFSEPALRRLLADAGFVRVRIGNVTPALWVAQTIIGSIFARRGRPTRQLRSPFLLPLLMLIVRGLFFPALYLGNKAGRGDCLVVEARKKA